MAPIGGPPTSASVNGRPFAVAGDASPTRMLGGRKIEHESNGDYLTGRNIVTPTGWSVGSMPLSIDDDREDQEFIQGVADESINVVIAVTYADGSTYSGLGIPTGDLEKDSSKSTMQVAFSGPGKFVKQG